MDEVSEAADGSAAFRLARGSLAALGTLLAPAAGKAASWPPTAACVPGWHTDESLPG